MTNKKRYLAYLIACMLMLPACSANNRENEEFEIANNCKAVNESGNGSETGTGSELVPSETVTQNIQNPFFYNDVSQPFIYQGSLAFGDELVEKNVTLRVNYIDQLTDGYLYELKLYSAEEIPEDRLILGYFYVQADKIYKINATEDSLDHLRERGELPKDSVVVCQDEGYEDALSETEEGNHQYLEVDSDHRVYHSYNNQVSSGYYETLTWELGKGLINYRSGYGAEADSMELTILSSNIDQTQSTTIEQNQSEDKDWVTTQKDKILQQNPEYNNCKQYSYQLGDTYVIVYEGPNVDKEDWANYYVDIWAYNKDWITQVADETWIVPDSFQVGTIGDQEYFRYDLSYATDSTSTLLMLDETNQLRILTLPGALYEVDGNDITVTTSAYDMVYIKNDQYSCGHTWKPYYYYLKDYAIIEYAAVDMSEEEFRKYQGANEILDRLQKEYSLPDQVVSFSFGKRENGVIHVNIYVESTDEITLYYETFEIQDNQSLVSISSGEGTYGTIPMFTD